MVFHEAVVKMATGAGSFEGLSGEEGTAFKVVQLGPLTGLCWLWWAASVPCHVDLSLGPFDVSLQHGTL